MTDLSRRSLIGAAATGVAAMTSQAKAQTNTGDAVSPVQGSRGAPIIGPW